MSKTAKRRTIIGLILLFCGFVISEVITTNAAHNTFDGYCAWRGLVVKSTGATAGYCKNPSTNQEFKIVLFQGKRYLDGDLPCGFLCF